MIINSELIELAATISKTLWKAEEFTVVWNSTACVIF